MRIEEISHIVAENQIRELKEKRDTMTQEEWDQLTQVILSNCNSTFLLAVNSDAEQEY